MKRNSAFASAGFLFAGCLLFSGCCTEQCRIDRMRHAELKAKFWMNEWPVNVRTTAMVYICGAAGSNRCEVAGGMSIEPRTTTLYIWPDWQAGQMYLSGSTASSVAFPPEYGVHFRPVAPFPELVPGCAVRLLEGQGPSKGKSLWVKIVQHPPGGR
jgi:hypothetical protein